MSDPVERALWFIENRFEGELSADDVARAAGVSRFHLSRLFALVIGQSMTGYARGRRLSEAARAQLLCTTITPDDAHLLSFRPFEHVIETQRAQIRACYQRSIGRLPPRRFRVTYALAVAPTGHVLAASLTAAAETAAS